jgi:hypothetical protein
MSFRPVAAKNVFLRMAGLTAVAGVALVSVGLTNESVLRAQSPQVAARPNLRLDDEAAGLAAIVRTLIAAFDQVDVVALGEAHERRVDSDLRIALVRHPDFAKRVRSIVVECGSATEQSTLDRYIRGENVPRVQLERVWKATAETTNGFCDAPIYAEFLAAVRDVNSRLSAEARVRVFGGHPGPGDNRGIEIAAVSVLKEPVLQKHGKALMVYGAAHFYLTGPPDYLASMGDHIGLAKSLDIEYPGRWFASSWWPRSSACGQGDGRRSRLSKIRPRFEDAAASSTRLPPAIALPGFYG